MWGHPDFSLFCCPMPETGLMIGALTDHRGVGSFIHHLVHFTGIADLDLEQASSHALRLV